jgi:tRNA (guanine26-N2/guanine27-N2)-dimethyltransferase
MDYGEILEGSTRLKVPKNGGISKGEEVFYNPHMRLNRDLTVVLCKLLKPKTFLDIMAGSGARGIRVANEANVKVTLNDLNTNAVALIKENAILNNVYADVESVDARKAMFGRRFDFVDLDPFGTASPYIEAVLSGMRWGNVLGLCATDTSALCGSYPKACMRKYDAVSLRCDCFNEIGLRILLGFVARVSIRHEFGFEPLFCHSTRHYMRLQVRISSRYADTAKEIGFLQYCFNCLWRGYRHLWDLKEECNCGGKLHTAGPLWTGIFADESICRNMESEILTGEYEGKAASAKLVGLVGGEQGIKIPYYDVHKLCKVSAAEAPKMESLAEHVRSSGYRFTRTHFNNTGFRTDMPVESLAEILNDRG